MEGLLNLLTSLVSFLNLLGGQVLRNGRLVLIVIEFIAVISIVKVFAIHITCFLFLLFSFFGLVGDMFTPFCCNIFVHCC